MSAFLDLISQDPKEIRLMRSLNKHPFRNIAQHHGGECKICHFHCDCSYIRPDSLKKLQKYVKYIPLAELSPRSSNRSYFTVGCICDIKGNMIYLSDLHACKRILVADYAPVLNKFDIIAVANAEIDDRMHTTQQSQIIRIGHNDRVEKCSHYGTDDNCSGFVDTRKSPTCDFHCNQMFVDAGNSRSLLKQNTKAAVTPMSSPDRVESLNRPPLREIPKEFVNEYIETHAYGRGAKFAKALDRKNSPVIASGFSAGDTILL